MSQGRYTTKPEGGNTALRVVISALVGLVMGAVIGFPISMGVGVAIVEVFNVSGFEGGSGYAVLLIMMIGIPITSAATIALNSIMALKAWPIKTLLAEFAICIVSGLTMGGLGVY